MRLFPMRNFNAIDGEIKDTQSGGLMDHIATKVDTNVSSVPVAISRPEHASERRPSLVLIDGDKVGGRLCIGRDVSMW